MTDNSNTPITKGNRPTHTAYTVREYAENKAEWLKVGVAWQRADASYDTQRCTLPLDGRVVHAAQKSIDAAILDFTVVIGDSTAVFRIARAVALMVAPMF
jgi:hypothetical protein